VRVQPIRSIEKQGFIKTACLILFMLAATVGAVAQQPPDADNLPIRIARARALAAAHNLDAASTELNGIMSASSDDSVRDVARILLMDVYLEQADYTKAQNLLEQTYNSRSPKDEGATRNYFALAGQAVNGAREHIARYRTFGFNVSEKDLPAEAVNDLNRLKLLLEKVGDQAKALSADNDKATDSAALLEEVASVRTTLSRDPNERQQWQKEFESAREKLAANETRVASGVSSVSRASFNPAAPGAGTNASVAAAPAQGVVNQQLPAAGSVKPAAPVAGPNTPVAKAAASGTPFNAGALTNWATQTVKPLYPSVAKTARVAGDVVVYIQVDELGSVTKVDRSTGPRLLQPAAEEAARQWKFRPILVDGLPVKANGYISFRFSTNP
jgi:TonB family protein